MRDLDSERADAIQRAQRGAIHRRQALRAGMTPRQVAGRLDSGAWSPRQGGVYVASGAPGTFEMRCFAALLAVRYAGRRGERRVAVFGPAAAYIHDLDLDLPEPRRVDLLVPVADSAPELDGVRIVRASTWPARTFGSADGLPVTGVADTIVDVAWYVDRDRLHALVQNAAFARPGLPGAVLAACRRGRTGSAAARRAAALVLAGADSSLHRRGRDLARLAGLPAPNCGVEVVAGAGPSDCVFPGARGVRAAVRTGRRVGRRRAPGRPADVPARPREGPARPAGRLRRRALLGRAGEPGRRRRRRPGRAEWRALLQREHPSYAS